MGQAALHVTAAPCRLKHLSPMLRKTGYLLFLFLRSSDLSHLRPATATGPTPDLMNLCLALSKCLICPPALLAQQPPHLSCPKIILPLLNHFPYQIALEAII